MNNIFKSSLEKPVENNYVNVKDDIIAEEEEEDQNLLKVYKFDESNRESQQNEDKQHQLIQKNQVWFSWIWLQLIQLSFFFAVGFVINLLLQLDWMKINMSWLEILLILTGSIISTVAAFFAYCVPHLFIHWTLIDKFMCGSHKKRKTDGKQRLQGGFKQCGYHKGEYYSKILIRVLCFGFALWTVYSPLYYAIRIERAVKNTETFMEIIESGKNTIPHKDTMLLKGKLDSSQFEVDQIDIACALNSQSVYNQLDHQSINSRNRLLIAQATNNMRLQKSMKLTNQEDQDVLSLQFQNIQTNESSKNITSPIDEIQVKQMVSRWKPEKSGDQEQFISFQGTKSLFDAVVDINAIPYQFEDEVDKESQQVHSGFFNTIRNSLQVIGDDLYNLQQKYGFKKINICGHSLGGAHGTALAHFITSKDTKYQKWFKNISVKRISTLAAPPMYLLQPGGKAQSEDPTTWPPIMQSLKTITRNYQFDNDIVPNVMGPNFKKSKLTASLVKKQIQNKWLSNCENQLFCLQSTSQWNQLQMLGSFGETIMDKMRNVLDKFNGVREFYVQLHNIELPQQFGESDNNYDANEHNTVLQLLNTQFQYLKNSDPEINKKIILQKENYLLSTLIKKKFNEKVGMDSYNYIVKG